jgi:tetratricopeptide (TPR) repeat protein
MKSFRVVGIFLLFVALLYLPFLQNDFVSDDISSIVMAAPHWTWVTVLGWPQVIRIGGLVVYWTYHLFGSVPWPYRLINILFHIGNVTIVWLIVRKHAKPLVVFVSGLLFAIHPLAIESVTWISGSSYTFYAFFFLLSLYWYRHVSPVKRIISLISFVTSLCISEKAVSLIIIFGLYEWMFGDFKKHWKHWIPYLAVTSLVLLFYITRLGGYISIIEKTNGQPVTGFYNPFLQLSLAISSYIELFVWPQHLTLYHVGIFHSWAEFAIRLSATIAYIAATLVGLIRKKPWGFWLAWVAISLGITLLPIKYAWIVAERYVYLGFIGFCVVAAMLFDRIVSLKKLEIVGMCVGIIVVIALSTRTMVRNSEWRTQDSLWVATLRESPEDPKSWNNMGDVYGRHAEFDKSIEAFTQATKINPNYADAYHNIGNTYVQMKKYDEAVPYFKKALSINPNLWQSYRGLAFIAAEKREYQQALRYIEQALAINPADASLQENAQALRRALRGQ